VKPLARWVKRLGRWAAALVGVAALLLALGIGAFRLAIDLLPGYQQRIVEQVREATGLTLEFDSVYARIGRYGPELVFRGARVLPASGDEPLVSAQSGRVSLSILRTLWFRRIEVGRFSLVRPRLNFVIHTDGTVQMVGQFALQAGPASERKPLTLERLPRGLFDVRDATLDVLDLRVRQGRFELTGANIEIDRHGGHVTARGEVELPEHLGSKLEFEAEVEGDLADAASLAWRGNLDAFDLDFEQWAALLPESFRVPAAGHGSFELSVRGTGRELTGLRLQPSIKDLRFAGAEDEFKRIAGDIRLQQHDGVITVRATGLELSRRKAPWRPTSLEARLTREGGRIVAASVRADYLRIENVAAPTGSAAGTDRVAGAARRAVRPRPHAHRHRRPARARYHRAPAFRGRRLRANRPGGGHHRARRRDRGSWRRRRRARGDAQCDDQVAAAMARARRPADRRGPRRMEPFWRRRTRLAR
jgi:uncharacterized protein YhdP